MSSGRKSRSLPRSEMHRCNRCSKVCKSWSELDKHYDEHREKQDEVFECKLCFGVFDSKKDLKWHMSSEHEIKKASRKRASLDAPVSGGSWSGRYNPY